ncbi:MAG TPA: hypothetical protein VGI96_06090, partial [Streptosporangiaceae bacterium]
EHIPAARALGIEAGLHLTLVFGRPLDDVAVVARLAEGGLACLPLSAFCAGTASAGTASAGTANAGTVNAGGAAESRGVPRSGLICGYSRLPETAAGPAAALIGRVTAELAAS